MIARIAVALGLILTLAPLPAAEARKKRILAIGEVKGWQHDSVSHALATLERLGRESGLWDTYIRTDTELITKRKMERNARNLDYFDAVVFYTTGELPLDDTQKADLLRFIREEGKGFIGIHSAADTFYQWPEYGELIGGWFDQHPWNTFQAPIVVEDPGTPMTAHFPREFTIHDEIYQFKNYSRDRVRVLMRLDETKVARNDKVHRTDGDFAVSWIRNYGKGRVFYSTLGHTESAWDRADVQKMYSEAIKWVLGMTQADATPRPRP